MAICENLSHELKCEKVGSCFVTIFTYCGEFHMVTFTLWQFNIFWLWQLLHCDNSTYFGKFAYFDKYRTLCQLSHIVVNFIFSSLTDIQWCTIFRQKLLSAFLHDAVMKGSLLFASEMVLRSEAETQKTNSKLTHSPYSLTFLQLICRKTIFLEFLYFLERNSTYTNNLLRLNIFQISLTRPCTVVLILFFFLQKVL